MFTNFISGAMYLDDSANPFEGLLKMIRAYQGPIQLACYAAGTIAIVTVAAMLMFAGAQTREKLKKRLVWIFVGIFLVFGTGWIISLTGNIRQQYFGGGKDTAGTQASAIKPRLASFEHGAKFGIPDLHEK